MIQSLEEIIKKCDHASMVDGNIRYEEYCPYSSEEISMDNHNYIKLKYCEGLILPEEHRDCSSNESARAIYDKYIFNEHNVLFDEFTIIQDDIDNIIKFRMLLSEKSPHLEKFNQLILRIYFEYNREKLAGLVQSILGNSEYGWAEEYVQMHPDHKQGLIFRYGTQEYNKRFGIIEESEDNEDNKEKDSSGEGEKAMPDERDWILQKFGG